MVASWIVAWIREDKKDMLLKLLRRYVNRRFAGACEFRVLHGSILQLGQAMAREDLQEFEPQGAVQGECSEVTSSEKFETFWEKRL